METHSAMRMSGQQYEALSKQPTRSHDSDASDLRTSPALLSANAVDDMG